MTKKAITEKARASLGLYTAAYMRWLQARERRLPSPQEVYGYIEGLCDTEGYARESRDVRRHVNFNHHIRPGELAHVQQL
jgi:hypothetical protein